jgi:hypothetical protein
MKIAEVVAGRKAQALKETPGAISVRNSTAEVRPTHNLDSVGTSQRYAGDEGSFALSLQNSPEEAERVDKWMTAFEGFAPWKKDTPYDKDTMGGGIA